MISDPEQPDHFRVDPAKKYSGRARHSLRAAIVQATHAAGSGLPALPLFGNLFIIWIFRI